ncbi:MAG: ATP-dependent RecD-like DNA helicase [Lachnospiraceae bacterium]|jgi:exodeoxyribonuclease V alpha subunit|nr:ATP-dependent RecD-like DNA helicase [Lachnospiraceae bacterium]
MACLLKLMEMINGYIDHIIYRNKENGYTVLTLVADGEEITATGNIHGIDEGDHIKAYGGFVEHPVYGEQFKISSCRIVTPTDSVSMERYLASGAIKGIGAKLAARIVAHFQDDTARIVEDEPERLSEVYGISNRKAQDIAAQLEGKKEMREAFIFLQQYGISNAMSVKIYNKYKHNLYRIMRENPYQLAEDISGIGFRTADEIALNAGLSVNSEFRIRSGITYVLQQAAQDGHICLPSQQILERCENILDIPLDDINPQLLNLTMSKKIIIRKRDGVPFAYDPFYYYSELKCAKLLFDLSAAAPLVTPADRENIYERVEAILHGQDIESDELQLEAIIESILRRVVIISGGPGTGKTTIINSVIRFFAEEGRDILLAAPTGRAAKRMTEATGYEAKTIHRLLEVKVGGDPDSRQERTTDEISSIRFERNEEYPLEADIIIVDEMSMVDINLFLALLKAVSVGTRLVLVGDVDQLPSVGPGQILRDIIDSKTFSTVILKKIFRQEKESDIVLNAHRINNGENPILDNKSRDFFFLERNDINVIYKHMIQLLVEKLPPYIGAKALEIQVLTPMRKGPLGATVLNQVLQKHLNPPTEDKNQYQSGDTLYRVGDKVMQIKNNYMLEWEVRGKNNICVDSGYGIYNGDCGIIREINLSTGYMMVEYDEQRQVRYVLTQLDEIELAYAITIHKSQGSEYPAVIMPLLSGPGILFNRNLLYTGVTRACRLVAILGTRDIIATMVANTSPNTRHSSLCERIIEIRDL